MFITNNMLPFAMKKSLAILLLFVLFSTFGLAKVNVVVSIPPQLEFVEKIGGERVNTSLMVEVGSSPHTYEPKPSQMKAISQADLYLSIGVEFETIWLPKFQNQNSALTVRDTSQGIQKLSMSGEHHNCSAHHGDAHDHGHERLDPHVWVTPNNAKIIARNIYEALIAIDKEGQDYYHANLETYIKELNELECHIKGLLEKVPSQSAFMVFHPSWSYYAKAYDLNQLAVEIEGKTPKPRQLIAIIQAAKKMHVQAIFVQPEFSDKAAQTIAKELGIEVIKTSALAPNWSENLITLTRAIRAGSQK